MKLILKTRNSVDTQTKTFKEKIMTAKITISLEEMGAFNISASVSVDGGNSIEREIAGRMMKVYASTINTAVQCALQSIINEMAEDLGIDPIKAIASTRRLTPEESQDVTTCPKCGKTQPRVIFNSIKKCPCGFKFDGGEK